MAISIDFDFAAMKEKNQKRETLSKGLTALQEAMPDLSDKIEKLKDLPLETQETMLKKLTEKNLGLDSGININLPSMYGDQQPKATPVGSDVAPPLSGKEEPLPKDFDASPSVNSLRDEVSSGPGLRTKSRSITQKYQEGSTTTQQEMYDPKAKAKEAKDKKISEFGASLQNASITSDYNLDQVGGVLLDYMDLLTDAHVQGGAGNALKGLGNKLASKGIISGKGAEKYEKSGAITGKKGEMILKMFPMLTQQIGKEGSIRLMTSVLDMIGATIPDEVTPEALIREQGYQTLLSLARISRAVKQMDVKRLDPDDVVGIRSFAKDLSTSATKLKFSEEEQKALDSYADTVFGKWDNYYTPPSRRTAEYNKAQTADGRTFMYKRRTNGEK
jgi:hypothetical protein